MLVISKFLLLFTIQYDLMQEKQLGNNYYYFIKMGSLVFHSTFCFSPFLGVILPKSCSARVQAEFVSVQSTFIACPTKKITFFPRYIHMSV